MSRKHTFPRLRQAATVTCSTLLLSLPLLAQVTSADVLGTVTDASGAIVSGAKVTLTNLGTHVTKTAISNGSGDYTFSLMQPGTYSVTVTASGFKAVLVPSIAVAAGDRERENATLQAGAVDEVVTVTADTPLLQRESSSLTSVITEQPTMSLQRNAYSESSACRSMVPSSDRRKT